MQKAPRGSLKSNLLAITRDRVCACSSSDAHVHHLHHGGDDRSNGAHALHHPRRDHGGGNSDARAHRHLHHGDDDLSSSDHAHDLQMGSDHLRERDRA